MTASSRPPATFVVAAALAFAAVGAARPALQEAVLVPAPSPALRFAVVGDNGTGEQPEYEIAAQMTSARTRFPFEMVIMLGDNIYDSQQPQDFVLKFEKPFRTLLDQGVKFYASLGNHDSPNDPAYAPFNMGGRRYYTYVQGRIRFLVLDTNVLDGLQVDWLTRTLETSRDAWRIAYFHHPLYSNAGRHGSNVDIRVTLEPLFVRYGIDVAFSGHDHVYERIKPQQGITYFVAGSGGKLANGDIKPSPTTAAYYDREQVFVLAEIAGDRMTFQAISRSGAIVDSGTIVKRPKS